MSSVANGVDQQSSKTEIAISKGWVQGVALVMVFGFLVMGILAYRTYSDSMPLPTQVVSESGDVVYTDEEITSGQQIFLRRGLQQYGSVVGHGAYLGPDFTAEYLRLSSEHVRESLTAQGVQDPTAATVEMLRTNRYDPETGVLVFTPEQVSAFEEIREYYADFFGVDTTEHGLLPSAITDPGQIHDLTAFFGWTAWAAAAERPGHSYSYTNNWPPEPRVDNSPTADVLVWSAMSLVALLVGLGALFALYGRWSKRIGWHGSEVPSLSFLQPGTVGITKAQKATAWFFLVVSLLFLVQATLGAAVEHYRADLSSFFGLDLAQIRRALHGRHAHGPGARPGGLCRRRSRGRRGLGMHGPPPARQQKHRCYADPCQQSPHDCLAFSPPAAIWVRGPWVDCIECHGRG